MPARDAARAAAAISPVIVAHARRHAFNTPSSLMLDIRCRGLTPRHGEVCALPRTAFIALHATSRQDARHATRCQVRRLFIERCCRTR